MPSAHFILVLIALGISGCIRVPEADDAGEAKDVADGFFRSTIEENIPARDRLLEMSDVTVFGRGRFLGHNFVGAPVVKRTSEAPTTLQVTMPFWVRGRGGGGQPVNASRVLLIWLTRIEGGNWEVQRHQLTPPVAIKLWEQVQPWLWWSGASYLILLPLALLANLGEQAWVGVIGGLLGVYYAIVISHQCFGGGATMGLAVLAYIVLLGVLVVAAMSLFG